VSSFWMSCWWMFAPEVAPRNASSALRGDAPGGV
jgi:hypothetical protein